MRKWFVAALIPLLGVVAAAAVVPGAASAKPEKAVWASDQPGVQHLEYRYGPIRIEPGQNNIAFSKGQVPKPDVDGFIVGITPNIRLRDGSVPPVDVVHLHHGVWVNGSAPRDLSRGSGTFFPAGEEKTALRLPKGYGYEYKADDEWSINYMIHDLTANAYTIFIHYELDFIPATAPQAAAITPARPIWMDVQRGSIYPVFDVLKGSGTKGTYTYPDDASDPYGAAPAKNEWTVDRDSVLLATAGHLHPGGLHDDLWVDRGGESAHVFESKAKYYEPAGAVSWDVSMTVAQPDWKVQVKQGDVLRINTTYDTTRASWYESMGIMVVWMADGTTGRDPFTEKVDQAGVLTHGHLPENDNHGGTEVALPNATKFARVPVSGPVLIDSFLYSVGDMVGPAKTIPQVKAGQQISYVNNDAPLLNGIWHTITACKSPCNRTTGIAYPLADSDVTFDSGQLGFGGEPTANRITWETPADLAPGTYTYFCRIHPFMRGAFDITT